MQAVTGSEARGGPEVALQRRELGSDEEIVRRVLAGERALYEVILRRHNLRLYRVARSIVHDEGEAEDVLQDTYVRAFTQLASFAGAARFSTWLTRIAVNEALSRLRRRKPMTSIDDAYVGLDNGPVSNEQGPEDRASDAELGRLLEAAIDELPEAFRVVFVLREVEELSTGEAAECLSIPEDTVKTRLHRARGLLQRKIAARAEAYAPRAFSFPRTRCDRIVAAVMRAIEAALGRRSAREAYPHVE